MKSYRKELWFNVPARRKIVRITEYVQQAINESGIKEGLVLVNAMNITASVFINDDESGLHSDYEKWLENHFFFRFSKKKCNFAATKILVYGLQTPFLRHPQSNAPAGRMPVCRRGPCTGCRTHPRGTHGHRTDD